MSTFAMLLYCFFSAKFVFATTFPSAFWSLLVLKEVLAETKKVLEKVLAETNSAEEKQYKKY